METTKMGRVVVEATIESFEDLRHVRMGHLAVEQVRRVTIPDALIDTGATLLSSKDSLANCHFTSYDSKIPRISPPGENSRVSG